MTIIAIVISVGLAAKAQCEGVRFYALGAGNESCGEYVRAAEGERNARPAHPEPNGVYSNEYLGFAWYAEGYLTGSNSAADASYAGRYSDFAGRMAWLENYCRRNPLSYYLEALIKLRRYLIARQQ